MSLLAYATNVNGTETYFLKNSELSTIKGYTNSTIFSTIQGWSLFPAVSDINLQNYNILSTNSIVLDQVVITAAENELFLNGDPILTSSALINIGDWSYYDAVSTVNMNNNDLINTRNLYSQNITNALTLQSDSINALTNLTSPKATITDIKATNISTININGAPYVNTSNWAKYPANNSTINANGADIVSGSSQPINIIAGSTLSLVSQAEPVFINSGFNLNSGVQRVEINGGNGSGIYTDGGLFGLASDTYLNLKSKGGYRGHVVIQADGGGNAQTPNGISGTVEITANGSSFSNVGTGGTILINANNAGFTTTLTSKIAMSASCMESYAGYTGARLSLRGYNYMWADTGCSICTSLIPPSLFQIPGTTYLYGYNGIVLGSDTYVYNSIRPYYDGITQPKNLFIQGRPDTTTKSYVILSNVDTMYMDGSAQIKDVLLMTGQASAVMSGFSNVASKNFYADILMSSPLLTGNQLNTSNITCSNNINTNNINLNTINGRTYVSSFTQISNFSTLTAQQLFTSTINGSKPILNYVSTFNDLHTSTLSVSSITGVNYLTQYISTFPNVYITNNLYAPTVNTENVVSQTTLSLSALNDLILVSQAGQQTFLASQYVFGGGDVKANTASISTIHQSTNSIVQHGYRQPFIQYGTFGATGNSGSSTITLSIPYTNTSYTSIASMNDIVPAQMSCFNSSRSTIQIHWANAGGGAQQISWTTMGDI